MAWIESHQAVREHRKTTRLMIALNVTRREAVGILHGVWWWALDNAPDGVITEQDYPGLAVAGFWDSDARFFADGLIKAGWADPIDGGIVLHDWPEYSGRLIESRRRNAERQRNFRNTHVTVTSQPRNGATQPNTTQPDHESSTHGNMLNSPIGDVPLREKKTTVEVASFDAFWQVYPRRIAKASAVKSYEKLIRSGVKPDLILAGATSYAATCRAKETEEEFICYPSTYLNQRRFEDPVAAEPDDDDPDAINARIYAQQEQDVKDYARDLERKRAQANTAHPNTANGYGGRTRPHRVLPDSLGRAGPG